MLDWPYGRRTRSGYADFGRSQIPPLPQIMQLTDRTTGKLWAVSWAISPDRISISDELIPSGRSRRDGIRVYSAFSEPPFPLNGRNRLYIDNSRIGIDFNFYDRATRDQDVAPLYATTTTDARVIDYDTDDPVHIHLGLET